MSTGIADAGDAPGAPASIRVAVACSPRPGVAVEVALDVPAASTALDAIRTSGLLERHAELDLEAQSIGIWGRAVALETVLKAGDRVEIYRPLAIDPKAARRLRAAQAGGGKRKR